KMMLIESNRNILKREFLNALYRNINPFFRRWKKKVQSFKIISKSFYKGELFERKNELNRQCQYLAEFAKKEGYTSDKIEFHLSSAELKNFNLLQKGVSRLLLHTSGLSSIVKTFHSWKEYAQKRKRIQESS